MDVPSFPNPNLEGFHRPGKTPTFYRAINSRYGATPGVDYDVPFGETMVASASGKFLSYNELNTGRAGGLMAQVGHPEYYSAHGNFTTWYAHLDTVDEKLKKGGAGTEIERGQPIGTVGIHKEYAKIMFSSTTTQWIDPDQYGLNHDYMDYAENISFDLEKKYPTELISRRKKRQEDLYWDLLRYCSKRKEIPWHSHSSFGHSRSMWSHVEEFRYLSTMYTIAPHIFPKISEEEFSSINKEFYANQPIVLTLPFKKPK